MPRPERIVRGPLKKASFGRRVRRRLGRMWTEYTLSRRKVRYRRNLRGPVDKVAAFIFGCQRSGTNMMLAAFDRSLDVDKFAESDPRAFRYSRILGEEVQKKLIAKSNAKCVLFKPICDSHRAIELLALHPRSKGVWIYRHYHDVANSAVEYWDRQTKTWIEDLLDGGGDWGVSQWNREKVTEECLAEVRKACSDGLSQHDAAALFWYMRNRTFFEQGLERNRDIILTRYEEFVTDPEREFERLCKFLQLRFDPGMVRKVFTGSIRKRPCPPLGERVDRLCQGMLDRLDAVRRQGN